MKKRGTDMKKIRVVIGAITILILLLFGVINLIGGFEEGDGSIESLPANVQESFWDYEANNWKFKTDKTHGTHDDGTFKNRDKDLPTHDESGNQIHYREHDVNNKMDGQGRDAQRFISGSDGSIYYTEDHYETFIQLK